MIDKEKKPHFYSGIDGSLYQFNKRKFYSNDKYCVDFFYFKNQLDPKVDVVKVNFTLSH